MRRALGLALVALVGCAVPAVASSRDAQPPAARVDTAPGSVRVGGPVRAGDLTDVRGRAGDDVAGVHDVHVLFCPNAQPGAGWSCGSSPVPAPLVRTRAEVSCTSAARLSCAWQAPVPTVPGRYLVLVAVADRAGRIGSAGPVDIVVV